MSYVPPHKRIDSPSPRPMPVPPPSSSRINRNHSNYNNRGGFKPDVNINYAKNSIRKWFPVGENGNPSDVLLEFRRFEGESFEHLRDEKLYTLSAVPGHARDVEEDLGLLAIEETSPWRYIWEKIKEDFKEAYQSVLSYMEMAKPDDVKPTFVVRFGRVLLHGDGLSWHASIKSDFVEKALKDKTGIQSPLKKTFETNIPEHVFNALKEKIIVGLDTQKLSEKDKYLIQVDDKLHPGSVLHLKCHKSSADEKKLELKKIELAAVRHLVADVSCFNKPMDLRMILTTEKYWTEEENMESIERIVKSASIEGSVKGGLHWPLGGNSTGNRFSVRGAWHLHVTSVVGENCTFKFQRANRAEFKASSGRLTTEITLKLRSVTKYLRAQTQWDEENIMNMLENFLKWVWTECVECDNLVHKDEH